MGIEPTRPAWKAGVLPLNYTRMTRKGCTDAISYKIISQEAKPVKGRMRIFLTVCRKALSENQGVSAKQFHNGMYKMTPLQQGIFGANLIVNFLPYAPPIQ